MFSWSYNSVDKIEESTPEGGALFLGNYEAARNIDFLQKNKIVFVLSAVPAFIAVVPHFKTLNITQKIVDSEDSPTFDMGPFLEEAADFIADGLKKGNVLVHCAAGISRSTTCLLAYYIKHRQIEFAEALRLVKEKRPIACPNLGFQTQLLNYQKQKKDRKA